MNATSIKANYNHNGTRKGKKFFLVFQTLGFDQFGVSAEILLQLTFYNTYTILY